MTSSSLMPLRSRTLAGDVVQRRAAAELHLPDARLRRVAAERAVRTQLDAVARGRRAQAQEGRGDVGMGREARRVELDDVRADAARDLEFVEHARIMPRCAAVIRRESQDRARSDGRGGSCDCAQDDTLEALQRPCSTSWIARSVAWIARSMWPITRLRRSTRLRVGLALGDVLARLVQQLVGVVQAAAAVDVRVFRRVLVRRSCRPPSRPSSRR